MPKGVYTRKNPCVHGSRGMYIGTKKRAPCRCDLCTKANAEYQKEYMRGWYEKHKVRLQSEARKRAQHDRSTDSPA